MTEYCSNCGYRFEAWDKGNCPLCNSAKRSEEVSKPDRATQPYRATQTNKITSGEKKGIGVGVGIAAILILFTVVLYTSNIPTQNVNEDLTDNEESVKDTSKKIQSLKPTAIKIEQHPGYKIEQIFDVPYDKQLEVKQIDPIPETSFSKPEIIISELEQKVHSLINIERQNQGLSQLTFDTTLTKIARSHSQDMADRNYFEHQSPDGKEPSDRGFPYGYNTCGTKEAISLQNEYEELSRQYDKYPKTISDPSQYQQATSLYNQLKAISSKLNSHVENKELFGGLAENISQNWTYDSITYVNEIPIYGWNTEEEIAKQTVDGWMNSKGHRENILSGFHSEGIGVAVASDDKVYITENFC